MRANLTHFVAAIMRGKLSIIAAAIVLLPAAGWSQEYTVTDLGTLGGTFSLAMSVNNKGQVVGQSTTATQKQALGQADPFLYSNGSMIDLGNFGGDTGLTGYFGPKGNVANAVNDNGVVAGVAYDADSNSHPFLWNGGTLQDLAPGQTGAAFGINASNVAVGFIGIGYDEFGDYDGYGGQFNGVGNFVPAPIPATLLTSWSVAINNAGQIAGNCTADMDLIAYGCLATGNTAIELLPLSSDNGAALTYAINAAGNTCGLSGEDSEDWTATVWFDSTPVNLGRPPHTQTSECKGMDDYGQYVGDADSFESNQIGAIFDPVNGARDLNKLIPRLFHKGHAFRITSAVSISNTGFIAAECLFENGDTHACLLTPNPVLILRNNIVAFAQGDEGCIQCMETLVPEAHRLPESLEGLTADRRETVITTVDKIGVEVEKLERERKISQPKALLLIHEAKQVLSALEPRG